MPPAKKEKEKTHTHRKNPPKKTKKGSKYLLLDCRRNSARVSHPSEGTLESSISVEWSEWKGLIIYAQLSSRKGKTMN